MSKLTPPQREQLIIARDCADAGIALYSRNRARILRTLAGLGYLEQRPNDPTSYDITEAGRAALESEVSE
jgi:hypothetical protein